MSVLFTDTSADCAREAKAKVFNTAELLEAILHLLPAKDIVAGAECTCRGFNAMIRTSKMIRRKIWRLPQTCLSSPAAAVPIEELLADMILEKAYIWDDRSSFRHVSYRDDFGTDSASNVPCRTRINDLVFGNDDTEPDSWHYTFEQDTLATTTTTTTTANDPTPTYKCHIGTSFRLDSMAIPGVLDLKMYPCYAQMQICDPPATAGSVSGVDGCIDLCNKNGITVAEAIQAVVQSMLIAPDKIGRRKWSGDGEIFLSRTTETSFRAEVEDVSTTLIHNRRGCGWKSRRWTIEAVENA